MTFAKETLPVLIFATASPSDEVDPIWWLVALWCYLPAGVASLVALGSSFRREKMLRIFSPRRFVILSILLSIFPICFGAYIHHIDFVALASDGTPASKPLWKTLMFVSLPVITSFVALAVLRAGRHGQQQGEQGGDGDSEPAV